MTKEKSSTQSKNKKDIALVGKSNIFKKKTFFSKAHHSYIFALNDTLSSAFEAHWPKEHFTREFCALCAARGRRPRAAQLSLAEPSESATAAALPQTKKAPQGKIFDFWHFRLPGRAISLMKMPFFSFENHCFSYQKHREKIFSNIFIPDFFKSDLNIFLYFWIFRFFGFLEFWDFEILDFFGLSYVWRKLFCFTLMPSCCHVRCYHVYYWSTLFW